MLVVLRIAGRQLSHGNTRMHALIHIYIRAYIIMNFESIWGKNEKCYRTNITRRSNLDKRDKINVSVQSHIADMNYEKEIIR